MILINKSTLLFSAKMGYSYTVRVYFPSKKTGDVIAISAVNECPPSEDTPNDWKRDEEAGPIPKKQGKKIATAAEMPIMRSADVSGRAFIGNAQISVPGMMRTMEVSELGMRTMEMSEIGKMRTMEVPEAGKMRTMEVPEAGMMKTMEVSGKVGSHTMAVSEVSLGRATTAAVAFGRTDQIKPATAVFNKEGDK